MRRTRDHRRPFNVSQACSKLRLVANGAYKSFARKIVDRFPGGEFAFVFKCVVKGKHGEIREFWVVKGSDKLCQAVDQAMPRIKEAHSRPGAQPRKSASDNTLLLIPGTAVARAKRARELLRQAWEEHVKDTHWKGKKQIQDRGQRWACVSLSR